MNKNLRETTFFGDILLVSEEQDASGVVDSLGGVVQDEQVESQSRKVGQIGGGDGYQVDGGVADPGGHVLTLDLLEVELRVAVKPVGQLDDEEELEHERHGDVGVVLPHGRRIGEQALAQQHVGAPQYRHHVEDEKLARFVELALLHLGQVQLRLDFLHCQQGEKASQVGPTVAFLSIFFF